MTNIVSSPKRNIEEIRRQNLEDNHLFLEQLLVKNIRNDFLNSARSILQNEVKKKPGIQYQKVERTTRYTSKVQSGEIDPYVPEWQRQREMKKQEREKILLEKEQKRNERKMRLLENEQKRLEREKRRLERKPPGPSKWFSFYNNSVNGNPYERVFQQRNTKVDERIRQDSLKHLNIIE